MQKARKRASRQYSIRNNSETRSSKRELSTGKGGQDLMIFLIIQNNIVNKSMAGKGIRNIKENKNQNLIITSL